MDLERLLEELGRTAERAGIQVRQAKFDENLSDVRRPRGGLCTLRGDRIILIDAKLPLPERIGTMAEALAGVDLEHLFLPPIVRATISAHAKLAPLTRDNTVERKPAAPRPRLRLLRLV
jgi:hypothetical protein